MTQLHSSDDYKADKEMAIEDKFKGSLLGAIIGDALGWPYEDRSKFVGKKPEVKSRNGFISWVRSGGGRYYYHKEVINQGEYSDDSQLLLATARSLMFGESWSKAFMKQELASWLLYERGGGGATLRSAESWSRAVSPWKNKELSKRYFDAGGNGVAMRILPHVFVGESFGEIAKQVVVNGISTHGHPRALLGALLYANALYYLVNLKESLGFGELIHELLKGESQWSKLPEWNKNDEWLDMANSATNGNYLDVWQKTIDELKEGLLIAKEGIELGALDDSTATLKRLNCFNPQSKGAGTVAALVSVYLVSKYASDPQTGMLEVLALNNADTDTLASMVGGLFGAIYGSGFIREEWTCIQDYDYICKLVTNLSKSNQVSANSEWWTQSSNTKVKQIVRTLRVGENLQFGPLGTIELTEKVYNETSVKNLTVTTNKFKTNEGQTIFIKSFSKTYSTKTDSNAEISPKKQSFSLRVSGEFLIELHSLFPSRFTARKGLILLSDLFSEIEKHEGKKDANTIDKISANLVRKGINLPEVREIVKYIVYNS